MTTYVLGGTATAATITDQLREEETIACLDEQTVAAYRRCWEC